MRLPVIKHIVQFIENNDQDYVTETIETLENLIIAIVKPLISQPDVLTIKIEDTPEFLEYHLDLDQSDVGRVIGRKGRTISAIRTIVYSVPTEDKKVRIVIDEK